MKIMLLFSLILIVNGCTNTELKTEGLYDAWGTTYNHEFLIKDGKKVETYWQKPDGNGKFPVLFLVHGHQKGARMGARHYLQMGRLNRLVKWGYAVVAISLPGYGLTEGDPDFCGPNSQNIVVAAIEDFKKRNFVDSSKMALMGYSRGAIVSSMVATKYHELSGVVLGVGQYDLESFYKSMDIPGIKKNIEKEVGTSAEGFRDRSALYHAEKIKTPLLVLHGMKDKRGGHKSTKAFVEKVKANGTEVVFREYADKGHRLDVREMYKEIKTFLNKVFVNNG